MLESDGDLAQILREPAIVIADDAAHTNHV
jgi:hypothetical protein